MGEKRKVLVVQHQTFGGAGAFATALEAAGLALDTRNIEAGATLPDDLAGFDGLLVLGGVMGANDDADYPHLIQTRALIREAHEAARPVLGICLGAQLIARALGGRAYRMDAPELGFVALEATSEAAGDALLGDLDPPERVMEWHHDSFDMPPGSSLLMTGAACRNQAFRTGAGTYGFQCHFEVTRAMVEDWVADSRKSGHDAAHPDFHARIAGELDRYLDAALDFCAALGARWAASIRASSTI